MPALTLASTLTSVLVSALVWELVRVLAVSAEATLGDSLLETLVAILLDLQEAILSDRPEVPEASPAV